MSRHLESERNRLRTALSEILRWVDENVQPDLDHRRAPRPGQGPGRRNRVRPRSSVPRHWLAAPEQEGNRLVAAPAPTQERTVTECRWHRGRPGR